MEFLKPFVKAGFTVYIGLTRLVQILFALIILALDAYVIWQFNKNESEIESIYDGGFDFSGGFGGGFDLSDIGDLDLGDLFKLHRRSSLFGGFIIPGDTPFTAFVMFTAIFTLLVVVYDAVSAILSKALTNKSYHIYGETVLEFLLVVFWLTSFAGVAAHLNDDDAIWSIRGVDVDDITESYGYDAGISASLSCLKAITGLGAILFVICLANFVLLVIYSLRFGRSKFETPAAEHQLEAGITVHPEK